MQTKSELKCVWKLLCHCYSQTGLFRLVYNFTHNLYGKPNRQWVDASRVSGSHGSWVDMVTCDPLLDYPSCLTFAAVYLQHGGGDNCRENDVTVIPCIHHLHMLALHACQVTWLPISHSLAKLLSSQIFTAEKTVSHFCLKCWRHSEHSRNKYEPTIAVARPLTFAELMASHGGHVR